MQDLSTIPTTSMLNKAEEIIDEISRIKTTNDVAKLMADWPSNWLHECSRKEEAKIKERFIKLNEELKLSFVDHYVSESYNFLSAPVRKALINFFSTITETKRTRQRRARKVTTKKLRFCATGDPELKALPFLTNPDKILGASAVLVWIPKRRMAVWLEAKDRSGLAVSGNNIVRFDSERSFAKTVRKPEELIQVVSESRKKVYDYLRSVRTTEYDVDGKMNKKYVIVRVW